MVTLESGSCRLEEARHSHLDKCLAEEVIEKMKLEKLFGHHVLTGVVLGIVIGLHYPFDAYKGLLVILAVIMALKVVATK